MARRPNFIVILTDDQGYGDLSCMGDTDFRTPHLDRLAASGVRFTDWYANAPVCSPTRAALLSGRYPGNAGVRSILDGHRTATGMPADRVPTLATALRRQGYRTAMSGKWHLGLADGCRPNDHGFEEFFGFMAGCVDYYSHLFYWGMPRHNALHDLWHNRQEIWVNGRYLTQMITERAVGTIRQWARGDQPFCLYVAYNAPHYPMHAPPEYLDRFGHLPPDRRIMAAMISCVDDGVGKIVAELERHGILDDTCITFQSDNGPSRETRNWLDGRTDPYYGGTTGLFKGHKFSLFEGGIRVPGIISYPGRIPAGRVLHTPGASMDIFPTLLSAAGGDHSAYELDGVNLLPHLADGAAAPARDLLWEQGTQLAIRRGDMKLVLRGQLVEHEGPVADAFLSDLQADPGERVNLAAEQPGLVREMTQTIEAWHAAIEARFQREFPP